MNGSILYARQLKAQGMSYGEIADKFNAEGMPTLSGRGKWDKRTIQRKLESITDKNITVKYSQEDIENILSKIETYENQLVENNTVIAGLNSVIEGLKKQLAGSRPLGKGHFEGWSVTQSKGVYRAFKKISGKMIGIHLGKTFDPEIARKKIAEVTERIRPAIVLIPKKGKRTVVKTVKKEKPGTPSSLCAFPFESRLRVLCPAPRTYRLDAVRKAFPETERALFDPEMKSLADARKIELLAGDASDCNPDDLIRIGDRLYVNFEWRA